MKNSGYSIIHVPRVPYSLISYWFKAGSCFDPDNRGGLAHMIEHLYMSKASVSLDGHRLLEYFESNGMLYSAFTGKEWTYYYLFQTPDKTIRALEELQEGLQLFNPTLGEIEAEKQIISDEINRLTNNSSFYIHTLANKGTWPNSQLGRETLGSVDSVAKITTEDVLMFLDRHYTKTKPYILILTPEVKADKLEAKITNIRNNRHSFNFKAAQNVSKPLPFIVSYQKSEHLKVAISFLLNNLSETNIAIIDFISYYLANGGVSKLNRRLRFKQHSTYWVNSYTMYFEKTGCLRIVFSVNKKLINSSLYTVFDEIDKLKSASFLSTNLMPYKQAMKVRLLKKYLQPEALLGFYSQCITTNLKTPRLLQTYLQTIDVISTSDVQRIAIQYFKHNSLSVAIIGSMLENEANKIIDAYQWKN